MKNKAFETTVKRGWNNGFQMSFGNGCTISIQFSKYSYCDQGKTTAEVAAWDKEGKWLMFDEGKWFEIEKDSDIMAYQTADDVAKLIYTLSQW